MTARIRPKHLDMCRPSPSHETAHALGCGRAKTPVWPANTICKGPRARLKRAPIEADSSHKQGAKCGLRRLAPTLPFAALVGPVRAEHLLFLGRGRLYSMMFYLDTACQTPPSIKKTETPNRGTRGFSRHTMLGLGLRRRQELLRSDPTPQCEYPPT